MRSRATCSSSFASWSVIAALLSAWEMERLLSVRAARRVTAPAHCRSARSLRHEGCEGTSPSCPPWGRAREARREVLVPGKRYSVFSIRTTKKHETIWVRSGFATVNPDDSMNVVLDVLPMEGQLHIRETGEKRNTTHNQPV